MPHVVKLVGAGHVQGVHLGRELRVGGEEPVGPLGLGDDVDPLVEEAAEFGFPREGVHQ